MSRAIAIIDSLLAKFDPIPNMDDVVRINSAQSVVTELKNDDCFNYMDATTRIATQFATKTMLCERSLGRHLILISKDGVGVCLPKSCCTMRPEVQNKNTLSRIYDEEKEDLLQRLFENNLADINRWFAKLFAHPQFNGFKYSLALVVGLLRRSGEYMLGTLLKSVHSQHYTFSDIQEKVRNHLHARTFRFHDLNEYGITTDQRIYLRNEYLLNESDPQIQKYRKSFFGAVVLFHELMHLIGDLMHGKSPTPGYHAEIANYNGLFSYDGYNICGEDWLCFLYFWKINMARCDNLKKRPIDVDCGYFVHDEYIKNCIVTGRIAEPRKQQMCLIPEPYNVIVKRARGTDVRLPSCGTHYSEINS